MLFDGAPRLFLGSSKYARLVCGKEWGELTSLEWRQRGPPSPGGERGITSYEGDASEPPFGDRGAGGAAAEGRGGSSCERPAAAKLLEDGNHRNICVLQVRPCIRDTESRQSPGRLRDRNI